MIDVHNTVRVYEVRGKEDGADGKRVEVDSHWNRDAYVVLRVGDECVTVIGKDLKAAIDNAMNTRRY